MLDSLVRPLIDPPLNAAGAVLARLGLGADAVTLAGFALGAGACAAIAAGQFGAALALIAGNRVLDGLDGAVARHTAPTDLGGYLDIVCDMIFYSGVPFAFLLRDPADAVAAAFLMLSFMGTGASFLAYAAIAAKRGESTRARGVKSMYHSFGLMEGTETIAFFVAFCLWPHMFGTLAVVFGALCWLTVAGRVALAWNQFGGGK